MKKILLLWIVSLTLGALALDGLAQEAAPNKKIRIILKENNGEPRVRDIAVIRHKPFTYEPLPEASQKLLREHGLLLKEGEQVVILRTLDSLPVPPPPPPVPSVPAVPPVPEPAAGWLSEIQVFPNPAEDQLQLRFQAKNSGPAVLRILDLNGNEVYKEEIADAALLQDKTIKLPASKKGMFLLQLEQGDHTFMQRVLLK